MDFYVNKQSFLKALNIANKATASRLNRSILECIFIQTDGDKIILKATDMTLSIQTSAQATVEKEGSTALPARLLTEIMSKFPEGDIHFIRGQEGSVQIINQNAKAVLQEMDGDEFPDFPEVNSQNSVTIDGSELKQMINQTVFSTAANEDKPILTGVLLETEQNQMNLVALDGYRLAFRTTKCSPNGNMSVVIPAKSIREVAKIIEEDEKQVSICVSGNTAHIEMNSASLFTRLLEGDYVKYKNILPSEYKTRVKVETKLLEESIERASILARDTSNNLIKMSMAEDVMTITSNSEYGSSNEQLPIYLEGKDLTIAFNSKFILDILKNVEDGEIIMDFDTNLKPCVIKDRELDKYIYLILPVKVRD